MKTARLHKDTRYVSFATISDTHGQIAVNELLDPVVHQGNILVHAGDFTWGEVHRVYRTHIAHSHEQAFLAFCQDLKAIRERWNHILVVPGNHDQICEIQPEWCRRKLREIADATLLIDESVTVDGVKFYGLPWTKEFNKWFFNADPRKMELAVSAIDEDADVLVSHGPPHKILDLSGYGGAGHLGSEVLLNKIDAMPNLKAVVFGHIHASGGRIIYDRKRGVYFLNAGVLDENYVPYKPFDLTRRTITLEV